MIWEQFSLENAKSSYTEMTNKYLLTCFIGKIDQVLVVIESTW